MSDPITEQHWVISESVRWYNDSKRLVSKCTKPDYEGECSDAVVPCCGAPSSNVWGGPSELFAHGVTKAALRWREAQRS